MKLSSCDASMAVVGQMAFIAMYMPVEGGTLPSINQNILYWKKV
jgi:hypothetical protein